MNRVLAVLIVLLTWSASPGCAQSMGTMTEKGVAMEVVYAVALLDAEAHRLKFVLLPFEPSEEELAELRAENPSSFWLLEKASPDTEKWPTWSPHGTLTLDWGFEPESLGDPSKAWRHVYSYGIGSQGSNLNLSGGPEDYVATLDGSVKEGETVTLTSEGSHPDWGFSWDLEVEAKVLTKRPQ